MTPTLRPRTARNIGVFAFTLLLIEFLDEFVFGIREAAWPLIRDELALDYAQIGLLLGVPNLIANLVEPFLGILGDVWNRRAIILGGGVVFGVAVLGLALSGNFLMLMVFSILLYPASGAFVSLSQASLMDLDPSRHEQNMARWTLFGSLGVVGGTLIVTLAAALAWGWRPLFIFCAVLTAALVLLAWRARFPAATSDGEEERLTFRGGIVRALRALRRGDVLRWLLLLECSDLMLDILLGFMALYFVDLAGATFEQAALAVTIWTVVGLVGDFLLIPLLERVRGLSYLRLSAALELVLYPAFLLAPEVWQKFVLLGLLGLFNAGWYSILQGQLYTSMPGQSGSVLAVRNVFGLVAGLIPLALGLVAEGFGLGATMWILLIGPLALLVGIPRRAVA